MASVLGRATKPTTGRGKDEVYVAAVALRARKGPAQLLMSTAYSLNLWDLQHFMVIIKPYSPPHSQPLVFDFQPQDPENIYVALAALSGRNVPGAVLVRKLVKLPKTKCWFIGSSKADAVDATYKFNQSWQTDLRIGHHDCRDYTNDCNDIADECEKAITIGEKLKSPNGIVMSPSLIENVANSICPML